MGKMNQLSILFKSFLTMFVSEIKLYFSVLICPNLKVFPGFFLFENSSCFLSSNHMARLPC